MSVRERRRPVQIVVENGEPASVIISIGEYQDMLEKLQDIEDLKVLERMRARPLKFRKLEEFLAENPESVSGLP